MLIFCKVISAYNQGNTYQTNNFWKTLENFRKVKICKEHKSKNSNSFIKLLQFNRKVVPKVYFYPRNSIMKSNLIKEYVLGSYCKLRIICCNYWQIFILEPSLSSFNKNWIHFRDRHKKISLVDVYACFHSLKILKTLHFRFKFSCSKICLSLSITPWKFKFFFFKD